MSNIIIVIRDKVADTVGSPMIFVNEGVFIRTLRTLAPDNYLRLSPNDFEYKILCNVVDDVVDCSSPSEWKPIASVVGD